MIETILRDSFTPFPDANSRAARPGGIFMNENHAPSRIAGERVTGCSAVHGYPGFQSVGVYRCPPASQAHIPTSDRFLACLSLAR